jgi:TP53 regulating kinase-like protein
MFLGRKCVVKERFEKKYRVPELDKKLTKSRIINESRNIARAYKNGIDTPSVLFVDTINRRIYMECIEHSVQLKELLKIIYSGLNISKYEKLIERIIESLGEAIAKLHNCDIIHGDLTTSNMLVKAR